MVVYRFAGTVELPEVARLNRELLAQDQPENIFSLDELAVRLSAYISAGHKLLLFERERIVIGYVLYLLGEREIGQKIVYVRHFVIDPNYRRKGFGREAMTHLLTCVWPADAMICVDTRESNAAAIAFWEALGFTVFSYTFARMPNLTPNRSTDPR